MKCQEFKKQRLYLKFGDIWWDCEDNKVQLSLIGKNKFIDLTYNNRLIISELSKIQRELNIWPNSLVWRKL